MPRWPRLLTGAVLAVACLGCTSAPSGGEEDGGGLDAGDAGAAGDAGWAPDGGRCEPGRTASFDVDGGKRLVIVGEPGGAGLGLADTSLWYPADAGVGYLAYSAAAQLPGGYNLVRTRLAVSDDHGVTWTWATEVNAVTAVSFQTTDLTTCDAGTCSGYVVHEVPALIDDAADPDPARRYKLFTHSYVETANRHNYNVGYIGLWAAADPRGPWSTERRVLEWSSTSSFSSPDSGFNIRLAPALTRCVALSEPGALVWRGSIYLTTSCVTVEPDGTHQRIVLFRSDTHASTFQFVGTLLDGADARCLGSDKPEVSGSSLTMAGGRPFLLASPQGTVAIPAGKEAYLGCAAIEIADLATATLVRDAQGAVVPSVRVLSSDRRPLGPCTFAEGASASGFLGQSFYFDGPPLIRLVSMPASLP